MANISFKNTGKSIEEVEKRFRKEKKLRDSIKKPIGIVLPLKPKKNSSETLFEMSYDVNEQVKTNLKNLLLTTKGEVLCNPDFGTNLSQLYNATDVDDIEEIAMEEIKSVVKKYFPFVQLSNFSSHRIEATQEYSGYYELKIEYSVAGISDLNELILKINISR
jgi:phage baseplate assembly protein W